MVKGAEYLLPTKLIFIETGSSSSSSSSLKFCFFFSFNKSLFQG